MMSGHGANPVFFNKNTTFDIFQNVLLHTLYPAINLALTVDQIAEG